MPADGPPLAGRARHLYVNGDPVNLVDPTGHKACADEACYQFIIPQSGSHELRGSQALMDAENEAYARGPSRSCGSEACPSPGPSAVPCTVNCTYDFVCVLDPHTYNCMTVLPIADVYDGACQRHACVVVGSITAPGDYNPSTDPTGIAFANYLTIGLGAGRDTASGLIRRASMLGRVLAGGDAAQRSWAAGAAAGGRSSPCGTGCGADARVARCGVSVGCRRVRP